MHASALEPFSAIQGYRQGARAALDGDNAIEAGISGAVNFAHTARLPMAERISYGLGTFAGKDRHGLPPNWNRESLPPVR